MRRSLPARLTAAVVLGGLVWLPGAAAETRTPAGADLGSRACHQTLEAGPTPPVGVLVPCPGVRPGAWVAIGEVAGCTLNFVFRGVQRDEHGEIVDEATYIGTAGHCTVPGIQNHETVFAAGEGPEARDRDGDRFGEVAYSNLSEVPGWFERGMDFALIRVDREREADVDPAVCHFGGPTGLAPGSAPGDVVHHFGQGLVFGDTVQGRSGVVTHTLVPGRTAFAGTAMSGDSGSPVILADGRAVAVLVGLDFLPVFGMTRATDVEPQLARAAEMTGIDFELVTADPAG